MTIWMASTLSGSAKRGKRQVEKAAHGLRQRAGDEHRQRDGDQQRHDAVREHRAQIHADDLRTPRADGLHDADLARLLRHERRDGVDDQEAAQQQRDQAQAASAAARSSRRDSAGRLRPAPAHVTELTVRPLFSILSATSSARASMYSRSSSCSSVPLKRTETCEKLRLAAQALEGVVVDIAAGLAHERRGEGVGVVGDAGHHDVADASVRRLEGQGIAIAQPFGQYISGIRGAVFQDDLILTGPARPFDAELGMFVEFGQRQDLVHLDVVEIFDGGERERLPLARLNLDLEANELRPATSATSGMRRIVSSMPSSRLSALMEACDGLLATKTASSSSSSTVLRCCTVPTAKMPTAMDATTSTVRVLLNQRSRRIFIHRGSSIGGLQVQRRGHAISTQIDIQVRHRNACSSCRSFTLWSATPGWYR